MGNAVMDGSLRKMYGDKMVVLGFAFNQGSFLAMSSDGNLRSFRLDRHLWEASMPRWQQGESRSSHLIYGLAS